MPLDPNLFPTLPQPPRARTYTVRELVFQEVAKGRIRIPNFQRPLRWQAEQNATLLDSLLRGYPVGSLLLWARPATAARITIGTATVDVAAEPQARWVVDGQQRIVALAATMLNLPNQGAEYLLHFAPHTGEFFATRRTPVLPPDAIPVNVLADARRLNRWVRDHNLDDAVQEILDAAHQRLVEYTIPAYEIDTNEEAPLRAIFARMNSTGARMRADEVFHALFGQGTPTRNAIDLDRLVKAVRDEAFGTLDRGEALKALLAVSGLDPTDRPDRLDPTLLSRLVSSEQAAEAMSLAVRFLKEDAGVPHLRLLPYPVVLTLLSRFFHVHPDIEPLDRRRLARWVWRAAMTGVHKRIEAARTREARTDIREGSATASIDRLLRRLSAPVGHSWTSSRYTHRNAATKIELLAMLDAKPLRLSETDEGPVRAEELLANDRIADEIWPIGSLPNLDEANRTAGKTMANRVLLAGHRSWFAEFARLDPIRHADILRSHLIDAPALHALKAGRYAEFFEGRRALIQACVTRFLKQNADWDGPLLSPIDAYLDPE